MTHASSRGALVFVRWLAVVAILLTFVGPFGTSAQGVTGEASPPAEATESVEPTVEPTEVIAPTEAPTEVIAPTEAPTEVIEPTDEPTETPTEEVEPTETPAATDESTVTPTATATDSPTETPAGTPTEESEFSAAAVTSGFSQTTYSGFAGETISLQYSISMDTAPLSGQISFLQPPGLSLGSSSASNPVPGTTCTAVPAPLMITATYTSSPSQASTCTISFDVTIPPGTPAATYSVSVSGSIFDSGTIQVLDQAVPSLSLSLSPASASVGQEVTVTATQYDPAPLLGTGSITVPIPVNMLEVPGSASASCTPECSGSPAANIGAGTASVVYGAPLGGSTITLTFRVVVAATALPGLPIPFVANGFVHLGTATSASTVLNVTAVTGIPLAIGFSDTAPSPGDTVVVTATASESPYPVPLPGTFTITLPAGVTVVPGTVSVTCPTCSLATAAEGPNSVTANYSLPPNSAASPQLTFSVIIGAVAPGTVLTFTGLGTGTNALPIGPASSFMTVEGTAGTPTLTVSISDPAPLPGETITVTVVQTDVAVVLPLPASITASLPPGVTLSGSLPTISCSPACFAPPTATGLPLSVTGSYSAMGATATTVTMTFDVTVNAGTTQGFVLSFGAAGISSGGMPTTVQAAIAIVGGSSTSLPLTISVAPAIAEAGQTVLVTASALEPPIHGSQQGTITIAIPDGLTLVPDSGVMNCFDCSPTVNESPTQVSATYTLGISPLAHLVLTFQATVDSDVTVGNALTITGSGTDSFGTAMTVTPATLAIAEPGTIPTLAISLSESSAELGESVVVTVTQFDPGTGSGSIDVIVPGFTTLDPGSPEISCDPSCLGAPNVDLQLGSIVHGTYTTTGPTTITMTFEVAVAVMPVGIPTIPFLATGQSANGTLLNAGPANLTVVPAPVPLTFTTVPGSAYPGDVVTITVSLLEGLVPGNGTITAELPDGVTLMPGSPVANCPLCLPLPAFLSDADSITMPYSMPVVLPVSVGFTFLVTIDETTPGGTVLSFTGSGTTAGGAPGDPVPASVIVLAPLAAPPLSLEAERGATINGDLTTTVTGGVPPYSFVEAGTSNPTGQVTINANGTFTYTAPDTLGADSFRYIVTDSTSGTALTAEGVVNITVTAEPIVTTPKSINVVSGVTASDSVAAQVTGGTPPYAFDVETGPASGSLDLNADGTFEYTANEGIAGTDQFTYTVTDSESGGPVTGTVTITIEAAPLETGPLTINVISGETVTGDLGESLSGGVLPYSFSVSQEPGIGELTLDPDGTFRYTAPAGTAGSTSFSYTVTDSQVQAGDVGGAATTSGEVQIVIAAAALTTTPLSVNVDAGASVDGSVAGQVSGGVTPYTFAIVSNPAQGEVTFNSDGSFTYTANADADGIDQFVYTVTDSEVQAVGDVSGAATATGVVDVAIGAPSPTPTETTGPTPSSTVTPGETPSSTVAPGETPVATATTEAGDPTKESTTDGAPVTQLPSTGQAGGGSGGSTALLVALLTAGMLLLAIAAGRIRRSHE